jgi:hypothetical protein
VRLAPDGGFELDLRFFRHHSEDMPFSWRTDPRNSAICFRPRLSIWWDRGAFPPTRLETAIATSPARHNV